MYPIFPLDKLGKIKVFACPATFELGAFKRATSSLTAQSNCISPSISKSAIRRKRSLASVILATHSPFALPIVEYDNNATFGSTPN